MLKCNMITDTHAAWVFYPWYDTMYCCTPPLTVDVDKTAPGRCTWVPKGSSSWLQARPEPSDVGTVTQAAGQTTHELRALLSPLYPAASSRRLNVCVVCVPMLELSRAMTMQCRRHRECSARRNQECRRGPSHRRTPRTRRTTDRHGVRVVCFGSRRDYSVLGIPQCQVTRLLKAFPKR